MKLEFEECPEAVDRTRLFGFKGWQEYVAAVPSPLAAVTGYKANGKANVTMQSWCALHGDRVLFMSGERLGPEAGVIESLGGYDKLHG